MSEMPRAEFSQPMQVFVFQLGDEEFAINVTQVREVHMPMEIFPVPGAPEFILGVINLRGRAVPVLDLKQRLGVSGYEAANPHRMVVAEAEEIEIVIPIDSCGEVIDVKPDAIQPPPANLPETLQAYITGMIEIDGRLLRLIQLRRELVDIES